MMPNGVAREQAEELYYYLFHISPKSHRKLLVKLIMNICFVLFLSLKLGGSDVTWYGTLAFLFTSNLLILFVESSEATFLVSSSESYLCLFKPFAVIVDTIGSFYAKLMILRCLTLDHLPQSLTLALVPTWSFVLLSTVFRCLIAKKRLPVEVSSRHHAANVMGTIIYVIFRGLQPLLIALKLDNLIHASWFSVLSPAIGMAFLGLGSSILLFSVVPCVHQGANRDLRHAAKHLTQLIASCLLWASACTLVFLLSLSQLLQSGSPIRDPFRLLSPLIALYTALLLAAAMFFRLYRDYQNQLSARVLQRLDRPASLSVPSQQLAAPRAHPPAARWSQVTAQRCSHWLIQISSSLFVVATDVSHPSIADCEACKSLTSLCISSPPPLPIPLPVLPAHPKEPAPDVERPGLSLQAIEDPFLVEMDGSATDPASLAMAMDGVATEPLTSPGGESSIADRCIVCFSRPVNVVFSGCGHAVTCLTCVLAIAETHPSHSVHCPLCRQPFDRLLELPANGRYTCPLSGPATEDVQISCGEHSARPPRPVDGEDGEIEMTTLSPPPPVRSDARSACPSITVVHSLWQYQLLPPQPASPLSISIAAAEMNNAMAIGNTISTLATINTVSYHFSLVDILL